MLPIPALRDQSSFCACWPWELLVRSKNDCALAVLHLSERALRKTLRDLSQFLSKLLRGVGDFGIYELSEASRVLDETGVHVAYQGVSHRYPGRECEQSETCRKSSRVPEGEAQSNGHLSHE